MAWTCVRCEKRIFHPRDGAVKFAMEWKFVKTKGELLVDLRNLTDLKPESVVTHLSCNGDPVDFKVRMREALGMGQDSEHPLLM